jgi:hypothetical protein
MITLLAESDTVWTGVSGVVLGILIGVFLLVSIIKALFPGD